MPPYPYQAQVKIVVACMALHNFIIEQRQMDEVLEQDEAAEVLINPKVETDNQPEPVNLDEIEMGSFRDHLRDLIGTTCSLQWICNC